MFRGGAAPPRRPRLPGNDRQTITAECKVQINANAWGDLETGANAGNPGLTTAPGA